MAVLIKSTVTRKFLTDQGTWTAESAQARDFKTSADAVTFCWTHALSESEVILKLPQAEYGLPVTAFQSHSQFPMDD